MPSVAIYFLIKLGRIKVKKTASPPEHRFWNTVDLNGPIHPVYGKCWIWLGGKSRNGYGQFTISNRGIRAHRYSYELHIGPIPEGLSVLHHCDNPSCVNPKHLFVGSTFDNHQDKVRKGRQAKGETNGFSKLSDDEIREIRRRYKLKRGYHDPVNGQNGLAREFKVTQALISLVVRNEIWTHVK